MPLQRFILKKKFNFVADYHFLEYASATEFCIDSSKTPAKYVEKCLQAAKLVEF